MKINSKTAIKMYNQGKSLANVDLCGEDLSNTKLKKIDLKSAKLEKVNL